MTAFNRRVFVTGTSLAVCSRWLPGFAVSPVAKTTGGEVRGLTNGKVHAFKGIPYGESTAITGRFLPPAKVRPWTGVRDAMELGNRAPQIRGNPLIPEYGTMEKTGPMSEDCLNVNVWTRGLRDGKKRPVMVWLHGGGYINGSNGVTVNDGVNLVDKFDVVTVNVNHRLNIFGFLHAAGIGGPELADASNVGMRDIVNDLSTTEATVRLVDKNQGLFLGGDREWDGVIIHEVDDMPVYSGVGVTAVIVMLIRRVYGLDALVTDRHLDVLGRLLLCLGCARSEEHTSELQSH